MRSRASFASSTDAASRRALVALVALSAFAWLLLWAWTTSGWARYLSHAAVGEIELSHVAGLMPFVAGWTLMIVAMMLPSSSALVTTFARTVGRRDDGRVLVVLLIAGYLLTWTAAGAALHAADLGVHKMVTYLDAPGATTTALIASMTFATAGAFQFSSLKHRCLTECRSPRMFVSSRWHGPRPRSTALQIGAAHGLFCIGCCWAVMLVLFYLSLANLLAMAVTGAVLAIEKNVSWGARISRPLGYALLAEAALIAVA